MEENNSKGEIKSICKNSNCRKSGNEKFRNVNRNLRGKPQKQNTRRKKKESQVLKT